MLTEEQKQSLLKEVPAIKQIAFLLKSAVENLLEEVPCKELQNIIMDLESINEHCQTLIDVGPSDPYLEVSEPDILEENYGL